MRGAEVQNEGGNRKMAIVEMRELLEAGVHFGHRTKRWHPKMSPYIVTERNGIHIIDIQQTVKRLGTAYELVREDIGNGGMLLFVGTKRQAQENIAEAAERCGMPHVNQRWLGGTLTNFRTIRQRIDYLIDLEQKFERGEFEKLTKKEILGLERKMAKLNRRLGGIKNMYRLPSMVFITDVRREHIAVKEANKLGIPIIAMVDTNCDPAPIDHIIPANDDAIRSIKLMADKLADAAMEGKQIREALLAEEEEEMLEAREEWEEYLVAEEVPVGAEESSDGKEMAREIEEPAVDVEEFLSDEEMAPEMEVPIETGEFLSEEEMPPEAEEYFEDSQTDEQSSLAEAKAGKGE
jgi:small subunit ribosomal protein S2